MATRPPSSRARSSGARLKRFLLRYFPPGVIIEYETQLPESGQPVMCKRVVDLLDLTPHSDPVREAERVVEEDSLLQQLIPPSRRATLADLISKMTVRLQDSEAETFARTQSLLRAHEMPITNIAFNKSGDRFLTGAYDNTCKVWNTNSGTEMLCLHGHDKPVFSVAFNTPFGDRVGTGSLDHKCRLWNSYTGECLHVLEGHLLEVVEVEFYQSEVLASGSMDKTAKLWSVETGHETMTLGGHTEEVVAVSFNELGTQLVTASFDHTARLWDLRTGRTVAEFQHDKEVSCAKMNFRGNLVGTCSDDTTSKIWDLRTNRCLFHFTDHSQIVGDGQFSCAGNLWVTCSEDATARVYNALTGTPISLLGRPLSERAEGVPPSRFDGHSAALVRVCFNPAGTRVLTASSDHTARLWRVENGECLQVLEGHQEEIFTCAFNYQGDTIITASKDGHCSIWRAGL